MTPTPQPWQEWPGLKKILTALGKSNVRVVGGAVRDALLGLTVNDIDLATPLTPDEVIKRLQANHLKALPTGFAHGTITAIADHQSFEITTLREDVSTDGRHAVVAFTDNWQTDAARRDFTINALYMDFEGKTYDYFGGLADIKTGRVRFIGEAVKRIDEDGLRILRFFRFSARFASGIFDEMGLAACADRANALMALSRERIKDELLKILATDNPCPTVDVMLSHNIFKAFLPEITSAHNLAELVAAEHIFKDVSALRRLAALLPQDATVYDDVAVRLKFSNKERKRFVAMATNYPKHHMLSEQSARALMYQLGKEGFIDQLVLHQPLQNFHELAQTWPIPRMPLSGGDLIRLGVPEGPDVSRSLASVEQAWIEADFPSGKETVIDMAKAIISQRHETA